MFRQKRCLVNEATTLAAFQTRPCVPSMRASLNVPRVDGTEGVIRPLIRQRPLGTLCFMLRKPEKNTLLNRRSWRAAQSSSTRNPSGNRKIKRPSSQLAQVS